MNQKLVIVAVLGIAMHCSTAFADEPARAGKDILAIQREVVQLEARIVELKKLLAEHASRNVKRVKTLYLDDKHCPFCGDADLYWYAPDGWECNGCSMDGDRSDMWDEQTPEQRAAERRKRDEETERIHRTGTSHASPVRGDRADGTYTIQCGPEE